MLKKTLLASFILSMAASHLAFAQTECPVLTPNDVRNLIDTGTISTNQMYTLDVEAGTSKAQVLIDEPTANPFDTHYSMTNGRYINGEYRWFYVGNILAGSAYEARDRAKKILLTDDLPIYGSYDKGSKWCIYKSIDASQTIENYPFKSRFESIMLMSGVAGHDDDDMGAKVKKFRSRR